MVHGNHIIMIPNVLLSEVFYCFPLETPMSVSDTCAQIPGFTAQTFPSTRRKKNLWCWRQVQIVASCSDKRAPLTTDGEIGNFGKFPCCFVSFSFGKNTVMTKLDVMKKFIPRDQIPGWSQLRDLKINRPFLLFPCCWAIHFMSAMALAMGMPACVLRYIDIWLIPSASSVFFSLSVCDEYPFLLRLKEISPPIYHYSFSSPATKLIWQCRGSKIV